MDGTPNPRAAYNALVRANRAHGILTPGEMRALLRRFEPAVAADPVSRAKRMLRYYRSQGWQIDPSSSKATPPAT